MVFGPYTNTIQALATETKDENTMPIFISEVYPNDKNNSHIEGAGANDLYEYIEIYNNTNKDIDFNSAYKVRYDYNSGSKDLEVASATEGETVTISANSPAVLWVERTNTNIVGPASDLSVEDFRSYHNIPNDVPVYMLKGQDGLNNEDRGFYITNKDDKNDVISHVHYASEAVGDGLSLHTKIPSNGTTMYIFKPKAKATPGEVHQDQLVPATNKAPSLKHQPKELINYDKELNLIAVPENFEKDTFIVNVFYKTSDMNDYKETSMTETNGQYTYTVPALELKGNIISYYFSIIDRKETLYESNVFEVEITRSQQEAPSEETEPNEDKHTGDDSETEEVIEPDEDIQPDEGIKPEEETNTGNQSIFFTEIYPNDKSNSHIEGAGSSDLYEFVEVYNNSDQPIKFNESYKIRYDWRSGTKDLSVTAADNADDQDVTIPANNSAVFWVHRTSVSGDAAKLTEEDFRSYHNVPGDVPVFKVREQNGLPNASDRSFYITKKGDNHEIISEIRFTQEDTSDGLSYHTRFPQEGFTVDAYERKGEPTAGIVDQEQLVPSSNNKPSIILPDVREIEANKDFTVQAEVTDPEDDDLTVKLFYRSNPYGEFAEMEMMKGENDTYSSTITGNEVGSYVFEYYIEASDGEVIVETDIVEIGIKSPENNKPPRILITEMTPNPSGDYRKGSGNQYEVMEIYNNSNEVLNLKGYTLFYLYPSATSTPKQWKIEQDTAIEPYSTGVIWFAKEALRDDVATVEDLNTHFNVQLDENDVVLYDNSESSDFNLPNSLNRGFAFSSSDSLDDLIVEAWYHADNDGEDRMIYEIRNSSVLFKYPKDGKVMERIGTRAYSNPGNLDSGQVPDLEGKDLVAPKIEHNQPFYRIEQGVDYQIMITTPEELAKATLMYGTAEEEITNYTNKTEMQLLDTSDGKYTYGADLQLDKAGSYRYMIETEDMSGNRTSVPYNSRGNPITVIDGTLGKELPDPGLSLEKGEMISGNVPFYAYGTQGTPEAVVTIDGKTIAGEKALPAPAQLNFQASGIDYIYQASASAIKANGQPEYFTRILPSYVQNAWYTYDVSQKYFIADEKVTIHSGSENVPYSLENHKEHFNKTNFDDYNVKNVHLILPDGSTIKPEKVHSYLGNLNKTEQVYRDNVEYALGDGNAPTNTNMAKPMMSDFIFNIPEEKKTATYFEVDSTAYEDGKYEVALSQNNKQMEKIEVTVDNTRPVIEGFINKEGIALSEGESLKGNIYIAVNAKDNLAGIDRVEAFLDGEQVAYPIESTSASLEPGTYELEVHVYDGAKNKAIAKTSFKIATEKPEAPDALSPDNFGEDIGESVTLDAKVTDPAGDKMDVTFMQGRKYDFASEEGIKGYTNVADREPPLAINPGGETELREVDKEKIAYEDGKYLVNDTEQGFPYHRFEITVEDELTEGDTVELYWKGKTFPNRIVTLYAWDYETKEWVAQTAATGDTAESDMTLSVEVDQERFVRDGKIQAMVQDEIEDPNAPFNMLWMTDTQYYAESYPHIWDGLGDWIVDSYQKDQFEYVIHTGDIVNVANSDHQWGVADRNLQKLDDANVPYGVLAGNHDAIIDGVDYSYYHKYVGANRYQDKPWYGGSMDNNRNHYDLMSFGGHDFIILYLGFGTEDTPETIEWANKALQKHADRNAIIGMHAYLEYDATLSNMSQNVYDKIVVPNDNVKMVIGGHYHGVTKRISEIENEDGTTRQVLEMLADYQGGPNGGDGYVRYLSFDPTNGTVSVDTYSPILDDYHFFEPEKEKFTEEFQFADIHKRVATDYFSVNVYQDDVIGVDEEVVSGDVASIEWNGLKPNATYYWYMNITDEYGATRRSEIYRFTTGDFTPEVEKPDQNDDDTSREQPGDKNQDDDPSGNSGELDDRETAVKPEDDQSGEPNEEPMPINDENQEANDVHLKSNDQHQNDENLRLEYPLPNTSTNIFNWIAIGFTLLALGILSFIGNRKRKLRN